MPSPHELSSGSEEPPKIPHGEPTPEKIGVPREESRRAIEALAAGDKEEEKRLQDIGIDSNAFYPEAATTRPPIERTDILDALGFREPEATPGAVPAPEGVEPAPGAIPATPETTPAPGTPRGDGHAPEGAEEAPRRTETPPGTEPLPTPPAGAPPEGHSDDEEDEPEEEDPPGEAYNKVRDNFETAMNRLNRKATTQFTRTWQHFTEKVPSAKLWEATGGAAVGSATAYGMGSLLKSSINAAAYGVGVFGIPLGPAFPLLVAAAPAGAFLPGLALNNRAKKIYEPLLAPRFSAEVRALYADVEERRAGESDNDYRARLDSLCRNFAEHQVDVTGYTDEELLNTNEERSLVEIMAKISGTKVQEIPRMGSLHAYTQYCFVHFSEICALARDAKGDRTLRDLSEDDIKLLASFSKIDDDAPLKEREANMKKLYEASLAYAKAAKRYHDGERDRKYIATAACFAAASSPFVGPLPAVTAGLTVAGRAIWRWWYKPTLITFNSRGELIGVDDKPRISPEVSRRGQGAMYSVDLLNRVNKDTSLKEGTEQHWADKMADLPQECFVRFRKGKYSDINVFARELDLHFTSKFYNKDDDTPEKKDDRKIAVAKHKLEHEESALQKLKQRLTDAKSKLAELRQQRKAANRAETEARSDTRKKEYRDEIEEIDGKIPQLEFEIELLEGLAYRPARAAIPTSGDRLGARAIEARTKVEGEIEKQEKNVEKAKKELFELEHPGHDDHEEEEEHEEGETHRHAEAEPKKKKKKKLTYDLLRKRAAKAFAVMVCKHWDTLQNSAKRELSPWAVGLKNATKNVASAVARRTGRELAEAGSNVVAGGTLGSVAAYFVSYGVFGLGLTNPLTIAPIAFGAGYGFYNYIKNKWTKTPQVVVQTPAAKEEKDKKEEKKKDDKKPDDHAHGGHP